MLALATFSLLVPLLAHPVNAPSNSLVFSNFASVTFPNGLTYDAFLGRLIVSSGFTSSSPIIRLKQIDASGTVTPFAPSFVGAEEVYIAVSPGLGGFQNGSVFVGNGTTPTITQISPDGTVVTNAWATCSGASGVSGSSVFRGGLAFDKVGTFSNNLLALSANGKLFRVDSTGACTLVADLGVVIGPAVYEGIVVPPSSFGTLGGQAWVGGDQSHLAAVSSTGTVTNKVASLTTVGDAENLNFVLTASDTLLGSQPNTNFVAAASGQFGAADVGTLLVGDEGTPSVKTHFYQIAFNTSTSTYTVVTIASGIPNTEGATLAPASFRPHSDFSISASSPGVNTGSTATSTITIEAINTFSGTVSLTDTVPPGLNCSSITPSSVTLPPSPVTPAPTCGSTTHGSYPVTVTGTNGSLSHSTIATYTVQVFDFSIS